MVLVKKTVEPTPLPSLLLPDLEVTSLSSSLTTVPQGGNLSVSDTTTNIGAVLAGSSNTNFYLSINNIIDPTDTVIGSRQIGALSPSTSSLATTTTTIPANLALGSYYLGACVDAGFAVVESNETNNCWVVDSKIEVVSVL